MIAINLVICCVDHCRESLAQVAVRAEGIFIMPQCPDNIRLETVFIHGRRMCDGEGQAGWESSHRKVPGEQR